uniref:Uncharacterized protein n=1 Tax=Oryza nivara TaxID=4536 RepID=A0A0E0J9J8_ORYNI
MCLGDADLTDATSSSAASSATPPSFTAKDRYERSTWGGGVEPAAIAATSWHRGRLSVDLRSERRQQQ